MESEMMDAENLEKLADSLIAVGQAIKEGNIIFVYGAARLESRPEMHFLEIGESNINSKAKPCKTQLVGEVRLVADLAFKMVD